VAKTEAIEFLRVDAPKNPRGGSPLFSPPLDFPLSFHPSCMRFGRPEKKGLWRNVISRTIEHLYLLFSFFFLSRLFVALPVCRRSGDVDWQAEKRTPAFSSPLFFPSLLKISLPLPSSFQHADEHYAGPKGAEGEALGFFFFFPSFFPFPLSPSGHPPPKATPLVEQLSKYQLMSNKFKKQYQK